MPSDRLLAFSLIGAAIAGAVFMHLSRNREGRSQEPRPQDTLLTVVVSGMIGGFLTFLLIKGGRGVFMVHLEGTANNFNPYTCSLLSLLVGCSHATLHSMLAAMSASQLLGKRLTGLVEEVSKEKPQAESEMAAKLAKETKGPEVVAPEAQKHETSTPPEKPKNRLKD